MGKNQHRRVKQPQQYHDHGWMSGFISLFDFRRSGANNRLPWEKRIGNNVRGEGCSQDMPGIVGSREQYDYDSYDISRPMHRACRRSVKSLIEEDMVMEDKRKHKRNDSFLEFVDFANDADTNTLVREILIRIQQKSSRRVELERKDSFCTLPEKIRTKFVNQLTDATKVLLHEKLIGKVPVGPDGKSQYSREFIDALETLISHKDLLFKLLEDPNSELTRRVNHLINSELGKLADHKEPEASHDRKSSLFSRRGISSQEVTLLRDDEGYRYTILEPGSETLSHSHSVNSSESGSKPRLSFSFAEIKRRLKRAMGKDREEVFTKNELGRSMSRRHQVSRINGDTAWMSPSRNPHLEVEIHPRRLSNSRRSDVDNMEVSDMPLENEVISPSRNKISINDVQTTKQRYYMLTDEILYEKFPKRRDRDLMLKCFSMPDRTHPPSLPPARFPSMPTARSTTPSLRRSVSSNNDSRLLKRQNITNAAVDLSDHSLVVASLESGDKFCEKSESQDRNLIVPETLVFNGCEDEEKLSVELSSAAPTVDYSDEQDEVDEDCTASSLTTSAEQLGNGNGAIDNRPSPTSVLEPIYSNDEASPPRIENSKGEPPVTPLQLRFEDDEDLSESDSDKNLALRKSSNDNESQLKNYITEILIASDFSWDTFYVRYLSSDHLLDTSLFDAEDDSDSDQLRNNYMLIFDLLNEVLEDACARYFSYSPWISLSKSNTTARPIPDTENTYQEILEEVESHLRSSSHPEDVEQIVTKEILKDGSLTDFRLDVETIGAEISDLILQKLIIDTALSCFSFTDKPRVIHL